MKIHEMQKNSRKQIFICLQQYLILCMQRTLWNVTLQKCDELSRLGMVVLCDRYMYTALARGYARGLKMEHLKPFYDAYFPVPDMSFYFRISVDIAAQHLSHRTEPLKHYEAGMDVRYSDNIIESFKKFQTKVIEGYDILAEQNGMYVIDGTAPVYKTTPLFIEKIAEYFEEKSMMWNLWESVLQKK